MECPFCLPALNPAQVIIENEYCCFLQQPEPMLIGSGIIVPKQHRITVFNLTAEEWQATFALLQRVKALLDEEYAPDGYNLGWNCGVVAGQEIFHAHLHVIPRFKDEPLAGKGIRYWLKQEANRRESKSVCERKSLPSEAAMQVQIQIAGEIDYSWAEWLHGLTPIHTETNDTILIGALPDQAALYGVLAKLRDLGLTLISVNSTSIKA